MSGSKNLYYIVYKKINKKNPISKCASVPNISFNQSSLDIKFKKLKKRYDGEVPVLARSQILLDASNRPFLFEPKNDTNKNSILLKNVHVEDSKDGKLHSSSLAPIKEVETINSSPSEKNILLSETKSKFNKNEKINPVLNIEKTKNSFNVEDAALFASKKLKTGDCSTSENKANKFVHRSKSTESDFHSEYFPMTRNNIFLQNNDCILDTSTEQNFRKNNTLLQKLNFIKSFIYNDVDLHLEHLENEKARSNTSLLKNQFLKETPNDVGDGIQGFSNTDKTNDFISFDKCILLSQNQIHNEIKNNIRECAVLNTIGNSKCNVEKSVPKDTPNNIESILNTRMLLNNLNIAKYPILSTKDKFGSDSIEIVNYSNLTETISLWANLSKQQNKLFNYTNADEIKADGKDLELSILKKNNKENPKNLEELLDSNIVKSQDFSKNVDVFKPLDSENNFLQNKLLEEKVSETYLPIDAVDVKSDNIVTKLYGENPNLVKCELLVEIPNNDDNVIDLKLKNEYLQDSEYKMKSNIKQSEKPIILHCNVVVEDPDNIKDSNNVLQSTDLENNTSNIMDGEIPIAVNSVKSIDDIEESQMTSNLSPEENHENELAHFYYEKNKNSSKDIFILDDPTDINKTPSYNNVENYSIEEDQENELLADEFNENNLIMENDTNTNDLNQAELMNANDSSLEDNQDHLLFSGSQFTENISYEAAQTNLEDTINTTSAINIKEEFPKTIKETLNEFQENLIADEPQTFFETSNLGAIEAFEENDENVFTDVEGNEIVRLDEETPTIIENTSLLLKRDLFKEARENMSSDQYIENVDSVDENQTILLDGTNNLITTLQVETQDEAIQDKQELNQLDDIPHEENNEVDEEQYNILEYHTKEDIEDQDVTEPSLFEDNNDIGFVEAAQENNKEDPNSFEDDNNIQLNEIPVNKVKDVFLQENKVNEIKNKNGLKIEMKDPIISEDENKANNTSEVTNINAFVQENDEIQNKNIAEIDEKEFNILEKCNKTLNGTPEANVNHISLQENKKNRFDKKESFLFESSNHAKELNETSGINVKEMLRQVINENKYDEFQNKEINKPQEKKSHFFKDSIKKLKNILNIKRALFQDINETKIDELQNNNILNSNDKESTISEAILIKENKLDEFQNKKIVKTDEKEQFFNNINIKNLHDSNKIPLHKESKENLLTDIQNKNTKSSEVTLNLTKTPIIPKISKPDK